MAILCATLPALCCCGPDPHYLQQGKTEHSSAPIEYVYIHSDDTPIEYQNTTNAHFGFHEGNLYYRDKSVLYRIEPMSGTKTSVCPDPVCEHLDAGCPVFSISSAFCFEDGVFYFDRLVMNGAQMRESISSFDISSGKSGSLYDRTECSNQYTRMMIYDGYLYFYRSFYSGEGENKKVITDIAGIELKSRKLIEVIKYEDTVYDHLIGGEDGYLYLSDPLGGIFRIESGKELPEKEYLYHFEGAALANFYPDRMALTGGNIYYYTSSDEGTTFWKIPTTGGEPQKLAFDSSLKADYCYYTQNYIYYSAVSQKKIGIFDGTDLFCDVYDIRRVSYETGVCEAVFCEFPEGYETHSLMGGYIVAGNYIYTYTADWGDLKEKYEDSDYRHNSGYPGTVARIDIQTGEVRYIGK